MLCHGADRLIFVFSRGGEDIRDSDSSSNGKLKFKVLLNLDR